MGHYENPAPNAAAPIPLGGQHTIVVTQSIPDTIPVTRADLVAWQEVLELAKRVPTVDGVLNIKARICADKLEGYLNAKS